MTSNLAPALLASPPLASAALALAPLSPAAVAPPAPVALGSLAPALAQELTKHEALRAQLLQDWPALDDETLADTLEGLTDLHDMLKALVRSALVDEAMVEGLKGHLTTLRQRLERLAARAEKKRTLVLDVMLEAEIKTLAAEDFSANLRSAPAAVTIVAEELIPDAFLIPQPSKVDRRALKMALSDGQAVPGVLLRTEKPVLHVRSR